ncbi:MFS transporter [Pilimelia terevasa]|uniref:MFS transporter n=1 Tax=Pilimelia terevasa TaxID=53372 RepID=A0A8J3FIF5_9ACTN|nr:MFS transporter [Pilimelia terevasa]GGK18777.1 MFS transporter [Pilimelia terevasa]
MSSPLSPAAPSPLALLRRNRDFRRLFAAELVLFGADWFVLVPLLVLLPRLTGGGLLGALVLATSTGAGALLLPVGGTFADRYDRRTIMRAANIAAVVGVAALLTVRTPATAWFALPAIAVVAVGKAFYSPAAGAALPNVVDPADLPLANTVAGSAWGTMAVVGASLGGILASTVGPYYSFAIALVCLVLAAVLLWGIRRPLQAPREPGAVPARTFAAVRESLRYIGARPRVRALVTVKSAVGLGNGVLAAFPLLALSFGTGGWGTGLLFAVRGAGALIGPLLMRPVLTHRRWLLPVLGLSMATYGLAYLGVAAAAWFPLVLALVFVAHLAGGANWVTSNFALQFEVPDGLRGRVIATDMMLATLAISVSQTVVGALLDVVTPAVLIAGCGTVTLVYAVLWRLGTRRLPAPAPQPSAA